MEYLVTQVLVKRLHIAVHRTHGMPLSWIHGGSDPLSIEMEGWEMMEDDYAAYMVTMVTHLVKVHGMDWSKLVRVCDHSQTEFDASGVPVCMICGYNPERDA